MTDEEKADYCGTVCLAARRMNIYGRIKEAEGKYTFQWFDVMASSKWAAEPSDNKKDCLVNGCLSLTNYLSCTNQH